MSNTFFGKELFCCLALFLLTVQSAVLLSDDVYDGVTYECIVDSDKPLIIHKVTLDVSMVGIIVEPSHKKGRCSEKVTEIAQRTNALVAINGGFFAFAAQSKLKGILFKLLDCFGISATNVEPVFGLKVNDEWLSFSHKINGCMTWNTSEKAICFDTTSICGEVEINNKKYPVADVNKSYASGPIVYTKAYGNRSPRKNNVLEFVIENDVVKKVVKQKGATIIPRNGYIYAIEKNYLSLLDNAIFTPGMTAVLHKNYSNTAYAWRSFDYFFGSTPLLLKDGTITDTVKNSASNFFKNYHPRTAVGILENSNIVMLVVEGRQSYSRGMTLCELATYMQELGCINALNCDGGGSSIMTIQGKRINEPSGHEWCVVKGERPVANALLVLPKNRVTGTKNFA